MMGFPMLQNKWIQLSLYIIVPTLAVMWVSGLLGVVGALDAQALAPIALVAIYVGILGFAIYAVGWFQEMRK